MSLNEVQTFLVTEVFQLDEANKALDAKIAAVADLEGKIITLEESLTSVTAESDLKANFISDLETAKVSAESQFADSQEALRKRHEQLLEVKSLLESAEKEVGISFTRHTFAGTKFFSA